MKQTFFYKTFLTLLLGMGSLGAWAQTTTLTISQGTYSVGDNVSFQVQSDGFPGFVTVGIYIYANGNFVKYQGGGGSNMYTSYKLPLNAATGTYTIEIYSSAQDADGNYIYAFDSKDFNVTGVSPTVSLTGNTNVCSGTTSIITANAVNAGSSPQYEFFLSQNSLGISSSNTFDVGQVIPGYYNTFTMNVKVYASADAPNPNSTVTSQPLYITSVKQPALNLVAPSVICNNTPATFTAEGSYLGNDVTYTWMRDGVPVQGSFNTNTFSDVSLNGETITVTASNINTACVSGGQLNAPVQTQAVGTPNPVVTASGTKNLCEGQNVTLTNAPNASSSYNFSWKDATNAEVGTNPFYTASQSGTYTMTVTDPNTGCVRVSSPQVVNVKPNPVVNASASGTLNLCPNTSVVLDNSVSEPGVTYRWKRDGVTNVSTTSSYTAKTAGSYALTATLSGCTIVSPSFDVFVKAVPNVVVTANGPTALCPGTDVVLSAANNGGYTYQWYNGATALSGQNSSSYTATAGGSYKVAISNEGCASKNSTATKVTQTILPAATITQTTQSQYYVTLRGNNGPGYSYLWYYEGEPMPDYTGQFLTPTFNGTFTLELFRNGCSVMSEPKVVTGITFTGGDRLTTAQEEHQAITIYPNPSEGVFNIASEEAVNVVVRDVQGRIIANINNAATVDLTAQPAGIYLMQIMDAKGNLLQSERLMKK